MEHRSEAGCSEGDGPTFGPRVLRVALTGWTAEASAPAHQAPRAALAGPLVPELLAGRGGPGAPADSSSRLPPAIATRLAGWGGTALGLVLLEAADRRRASGAPDPLVLTVGAAVRQGLPTAARASVLARAPGTGLLGLGQVGSELGAGLAQLADALVLEGRTSVPDAVLALDDRGARLVRVPELPGCTPRERLARLGRALGPGAALTFGPGAEVGARFASLVAGNVSSGGHTGTQTGTHTGDASMGAVHLVGRGGLGAVLARTGLQALHVASPDGASASADEELLRALLRSPRLAQRASTGSLELFAAERARSGAASSEQEVAGAASDRGQPPAPVDRHGCRGCPTPCGWSFRRGDAPEEAPRQPGRFAALRALGEDLGLARGADGLELLARCDALAVDAKEVGALLALLLRAFESGRLDGQSPRGDRAALAGWIDVLAGPASGPRTALPEELAHAAREGAAAFAEALGFEHSGVHGATARDGQREGAAGGLAALVGQCTSAGGADPMRTFPFLLEALDREGLERVVGAPLPAGADDPDVPAGKGLLAWWHQNLVAGLDLTGFCAFSAAGLLADGVVELDALAARLGLGATPDPGWEELGPAATLLARGANVALFARALDARWGTGPDRDAPAWARERLAHPELLPRHRALRGIGPDGRPRAEALAALGTPGPGRVSAAPVRGDRAGQADAGYGEGTARTPAPGSASSAASSGRLVLAGDGALGAALEAAARKSGGDPGAPSGSGPGTLSWPLSEPLELGALLEAIASAEPTLAPLLWTSGRPLPAVWRAGRRLRADALVRPGERLELVLAIAGG